jgi:hypothetical protein
MSHLVEAARAAVFSQLRLMIEGAIYDHIPQDTQPPFRHLGEIEWEPAGAKYDDTLRVTIELVTLYRGEDRAALTAMVAANRAALHERHIHADEAVIQQLVEIGGSISDAASDGVTYAAIQHFEMEVEPA